MANADGRNLERRVTRRAPAVSIAVFTLFALSGVVPTAQAQTEESRGFLSINGGIQAAGEDFSGRGAFDDPLFGPERASFEADYGAATDNLFDVGGGVRVRGNLAVGAAVSLASRESDAAVSAQLPHPFLFERPRAISGTAAGLARTETAVHLQVQYMIPVSSSFTVTLFGGPTWFNVAQDLVSGVDFDHEYPYDSARFTGARAAEQSASAIGVHAGADAAFYFSRAIGVGGTVRFSRGTVEFDAPSGGAVESTAGGLQTSGGLRIRF